MKIVERIKENVITIGIIGGILVLTTAAFMIIKKMLNGRHYGGNKDSI